MVFKSIGIEIKKLTPLTPMMNSRMENFIRAIKTECLNKIIFTNEAQLQLAVKEYLEYWNHYRPPCRSWWKNGKALSPGQRWRDYRNSISWRFDARVSQKQ